MDLELAKVKALYYAKVVELGSYEEASKLIQCEARTGEWSDMAALEPTWTAPRYRIKPDTVIHPGGEMPRPLTVEEAEKEIEVHVPFIYFDSWVVETNTYQSEYNKFESAKLGLAFKTKEDAIAASYVIFNLPKPEGK